MKSRLYIICLLVLGIFSTATHAQKVDGVYVGAQLYNTPYNGMQIDNIVVYFRPDGTYTDKLNTPGWKTNVTGKYHIKGGYIQFGDNKYKLAGNGNLESTSGINHTLHKVKNVTSLPAAGYESRSASSSGGMGTGMPNVAAFASNYLYFDGKGNFTANRDGVVGIGGDVAGGSIGGKSTSNKSAKGTYKLGAGEIALTYSNGKTARHSFFYSPPNEEDLIVLDGEFYFREETEKSSTKTTTGRAKTTTNSAASIPSPATSATAAGILAKLRSQYGGESIDKINTVKETSTISGGFDAITLIDIAANKLRLEIWQQKKLITVKQLEGAIGWEWTNGVKKALSANDKTEMMLNMYQGIIGLHKKQNNHFLTATVTQSGNDYILTFNIDNNKVVYMVDASFNLKANGYMLNGARNYSVYSKFIKKDGISYPSVTESADGSNIITQTTTAIEFNPILTDNDWKTP